MERPPCQIQQQIDRTAYPSPDSPLAYRARLSTLAVQIIPPYSLIITAYRSTDEYRQPLDLWCSSLQTVSRSDSKYPGGVLE